MSGNSYQRLSGNVGNIPEHPPEYDFMEVRNGRNGNTSTVEQFEIEETDYNEANREGILRRASLVTKKFATNFSNNVWRPFSRMVDPIYECFKYFNSQYERSILKLGNPLVVKRLLYVISVLIIVFFLTRWDYNEGVSGSGGGAFTAGQFFDVEKLGTKIISYINPREMKENLEYFSSMPHLSGTKGDLALARYVESYMVSNGIKINSFTELQSNINYPDLSGKETYVKLADGTHEATLYELAKEGLEYSAFNPNSLNTNGEIEGHYVYCGTGSYEELKKLTENSVMLKDSILLIKYGGDVPEAIKVEWANQNGARAVVFISNKFEIDHGDRHDVFDDVIQKTNIGLSRLSPGDVLTPGWSSEGDMSRVPWSKSSTTPKLPTIPISYKDGEVFLSKLGTKGFKMDGDVYSGDGKDGETMKLKITNIEMQTHRIWNVVGSIQGREQPEMGVIIGASRDSLCYGTSTSNTGSTILLELVRIFTDLQRQFNWSPSRSVYFASFDGTQYNLAGATEWVENREDSVKRQGFAYIDLSDAIAGNDLLIKGNPLLQKVIERELKKVKRSKDSDDSLYDLFKSQGKEKSVLSNNMIEEKNYIPFINHMNIPSLEIKFGGTGFPENSCLDSFESFENYGLDSDMSKHSALTELLARIILQLAEQPVIPFEYDNLVAKLSSYNNDLQKYSNDEKGDDSSGLSFDVLTKSLSSLKSAARAFREWKLEWEKFLTNTGQVEPSIVAMDRWKRNQNMIVFNEQFLYKNPGSQRAGYQNNLFGVSYIAPAHATDSDGYQWNTFPMIRDDIYNKDFVKAQKDIELLSKMINTASYKLVNG